jgi:nitrate reductase cytochrome c-type subunit
MSRSARISVAAGVVAVVGATLAAQRSEPAEEAPAVSPAEAGRAERAAVTEGGIDAETGFASNAFPPTMPDIAEHANAWERNDCLRCHETGVREAPIIRHASVPELALAAKCRSCHVLVPGQESGRGLVQEDPDVPEVEFLENAFPPMMPNTTYHVNAWTDENCLLCHEEGVAGAPIVDHDERLPAIALEAKCRSCHVMVRSHEAPVRER